MSSSRERVEVRPVGESRPPGGAVLPCPDVGAAGEQAEAHRSVRRWASNSSSRLPLGQDVSSVSWGAVMSALVFACTARSRSGIEIGQRLPPACRRRRRRLAST